MNICMWSYQDSGRYNSIKDVLISRRGSVAVRSGTCICLVALCRRHHYLCIFLCCFVVINQYSLELGSAKTYSYSLSGDTQPSDPDP